VRQVNEIGSDQPGGSRAHQTTPEIMAGITKQVHRPSTPGPDGHRLDETWRIRPVIQTLHRIPGSRNRSVEKDLEVILRDRFLAHAMASDPHAAGQIHKASADAIADVV
jgi:hypothetical protein